MIIGTTVDGL